MLHLSICIGLGGLAAHSLSIIDTAIKSQRKRIRTSDNTQTVCLKSSKIPKGSLDGDFELLFYGSMKHGFYYRTLLLRTVVLPPIAVAGETTDSTKPILKELSR